VIADLQVADPAALATGLPDVRVAQAAGTIAEAALAGARGFVLEVCSGGRYLPDSASSIGLEAVDPLLADPLRDTDTLWDDLCAARYGKAAPQAKFVLQEATLANDLIFKVLRLRFLWNDAHLASLAQARERLQPLAEVPAEGIRQAARSLLRPDDATVSRVEIEGETALWHAKQCPSPAEEAMTAAPGPPTQRLSESVGRLQQAAQLSQVAAQAFIETQLYAQDAAPPTLAAAQGALEGLGSAAAEVAAAIPDSPMLEGVDAFIASARKSLDESPQRAPIAQAFRRVRELSAAGQQEEAAQALADTLTNRDFIPHLHKHWPTVGELASSLRALGMAGGDLSLRWGGDGQWKLEKVGGRWCCVTYDKGPCIYLDVAGKPLNPAADYVLSFEYFDQGDWEFSVQYDSDHPADQNATYYPAGPIKLTNTKAWKEGSLALTRCRFAGGENMEADMRFLSGKGVCIRSVKLVPKQ
jgi:hypothetical protein